jgi:hypothetical protein
MVAYAPDAIRRRAGLLQTADDQGTCFAQELTRAPQDPGAPSNFVTISAENWPRVGYSHAHSRSNAVEPAKQAARRLHAYRQRAIRYVKAVAARGSIKPSAPIRRASPSVAFWGMWRPRSRIPHARGLIADDKCTWLVRRPARPPDAAPTSPPGRQLRAAAGPRRAARPAKSARPRKHRARGG